jgi:hypothetical protein
MLRGSSRSLVPLFALTAALWLDAGAAAANGNVMVGAVTPGGDVNINGDAGNNDVTITQNANGTVTVTGHNGTTVNGGASHTTTTPVTGEIDVNTRGGDDKVTVDGVTNVEDLDLEDNIGDNEIVVKKSKFSDKMKIENNDGSIDVDDTRWGRRDVRPGRGTVNPPSINGRGGAGQVGTPPTAGSGKKPPRDGSKAARRAQQDGLPTKNPGQRGVITPELPNAGSGYGYKGPKGPPKGSKY